MDYPQGPYGERNSPERRFSYGELMKSALRISWRNKFLWFFGLFVGGGLTSNLNFPTNLGGGQQDQEVPGLDQLFSSTMQNASSTGFSGALPLGLQSGPGGGTIALIIGAVILALVLVLAVIALIIISQGGLASSVAAIDGGEERRFGQTWRAGLSNFWRVLLQAILLFLIGVGLFVAVAAIVGLPVLFTFLLSQSVGLRVAMSVIFGIVGVLLFIAIFVPFAIVSQLAVRELVVGRSGVAASIGGAYGLFRRNFGRSLLVWLLNIGLKIAVGIATLIVLGLAGLILLGPGIAAGLSGAMTTGIALGIVGGVLFLLPALLVSAATGTYFHSYWTLAYLRLNGTGGAAVPVSSTPSPPSDSAHRGEGSEQRRGQQTAMLRRPEDEQGRQEPTDEEKPRNDAPRR